jgi:hypothetical protein
MFVWKKPINPLINSPIGSISGEKPAKALAVEALIGSADFPSKYDDPNYDPDYEQAREADYRARGLIE